MVAAVSVSIVVEYSGLRGAVYASWLVSRWTGRRGNDEWGRLPQALFSRNFASAGSLRQGKDAGRWRRKCWSDRCPRLMKKTPQGIPCGVRPEMCELVNRGYGCPSLGAVR